MFGQLIIQEEKIKVIKSHSDNEEGKIVAMKFLKVLPNIKNLSYKILEFYIEQMRNQEHLKNL